LFGKCYALAITVVIDGSHPLEKEMRIINEHYINWLNRRGKHCEDLVLGFTAPPNFDAAILAQCRRLLMQDVGNERTLAAMNVDVVVVNAESEESKEYKLKWDPNALAEVDVPGHKLAQAPAPHNSSSPDEDAMIFQGKNEELERATAEAKRRIPELKKLLNSPQAGVTVHIPCVDGDIRNVYEADLVGRKGDELEVEFTPDYAPGPVRKKIQIEEILDWTVHHENGATTGGFTARAMLKA
jgi:hypothetical protein